MERERGYIWNIIIILYIRNFLKSIHFLADNIHSLDPEALSGTPFLPPTTKLAIAKIVSRRRQLNNELLEIFLGEEEERVELFDVARIDGTGFVKIASGCGESLKVLRLELAGR